MSVWIPSLVDSRAFELRFEEKASIVLDIPAATIYVCRALSGSICWLLRENAQSLLCVQGPGDEVVLQSDVLHEGVCISGPAALVCERKCNAEDLLRQTNALASSLRDCADVAAFEPRFAALVESLEAAVKKPSGLPRAWTRATSVEQDALLQHTKLLEMSGGTLLALSKGFLTAPSGLGHASSLTRRLLWLRRLLEWMSVRVRSLPPELARMVIMFAAEQATAEGGSAARVLSQCRAVSRLWRVLVDDLVLPPLLKRSCQSFAALAPSLMSATGTAAIELLRGAEAVRLSEIDGSFTEPLQLSLDIDGAAPHLHEGVESSSESWVETLALASEQIDDLIVDAALYVFWALRRHADRVGGGAAGRGGAAGPELRDGAAGYSLCCTNVRVDSRSGPSAVAAAILRIASAVAARMRERGLGVPKLFLVVESCVLPRSLYGLFRDLVELTGGEHRCSRSIIVMR